MVGLLLSDYVSGCGSRSPLRAAGVSVRGVCLSNTLSNSYKMQVQSDRRKDFGQTSSSVGKQGCRDSGRVSAPASGLQAEDRQQDANLTSLAIDHA